MQCKRGAIAKIATIATIAAPDFVFRKSKVFLACSKSIIGSGFNGQSSSFDAYDSDRSIRRDVFVGDDRPHGIADFYFAASVGDGFIDLKDLSDILFGTVIESGGDVLFFFISLRPTQAEMTARTAKIIPNTAGVVSGAAKSTIPVMKAAIPIHIKNTPGVRISKTRKTAAAIIQYQ